MSGMRVRTCASAGATESTPKSAPSFRAALRDTGLARGGTRLTRKGIEIAQLNIGLYCNQACSHCHVESSPLRTEMMQRDVSERVMQLIDSTPTVHTVDLTGGAPELNIEFKYLVEAARSRGLKVLDRCNLTVLFEPGQEDLAEFLAAHEVDVVASLPCYSSDNVDSQRGRGTFEKSIDALKKLNSLGYGQPGSGLILNLVYNPNGTFLAPSQAKLEAAYKHELMDCYGIVFNQLFCLNNMPVKRFKDYLVRKNQLDDYMALLSNAFNPAAVEGLMCRNLVSIGWDGQVFDCDFNQQLGMPVECGKGLTVFDIESFDDLAKIPIKLGDHCFGCTAGEGSSCSGATV